MVIYGDYKCEWFKSIDGLSDPLFVEWLKQIKELDWDGYSLWIYGGILEWKTSDIDGTILGPRDPARINYLLDNIVRISYALHVEPDIKWTDQGLYDYNRDTVKTIKHAHYRGSKIHNGKLIEFGKLENYLWVAEREWPIKAKHKKDWKYHSPMKLI